MVALFCALMVPLAVSGGWVPAADYLDLAYRDKWLVLCSAVAGFLSSGLVASWIGRPDEGMFQGTFQAFLIVGVLTASANGACLAMAKGPLVAFAGGLLYGPAVLAIGIGYNPIQTGLLIALGLFVCHWIGRKQHV